MGEDGVFPSAEAARAAGARLTRGDAFLLDRRSKPEFGDVSKLERLPPDGRGEEAVRVNNQRAEIVGGFELGTGFSWNGMLMSGEEAFAKYTMLPAEHGQLRAGEALARCGPRSGAASGFKPPSRRT